ncbi:MAG: DUF4954 family protein [Rikenellaceae bacterium]
MNSLNRVSEEQIAQLVARGCMAQDWSEILVSDDFDAAQLFGVRMSGRVLIGRGARLSNVYISNYEVGEGALVEDVKRLECRCESSFGNGVEVASVNENGGRSILIYNALSAQMAYMWTMYRHREEACRRMSTMAESFARSRRSSMGHVGAGARVVGAGLIREVNICDGVVVEGASLVENVTLLAGCRVGVDVKLRDAIVAEDARVDTGATLERVFVGECAVVASGFSAVDSLIFASSHLENGEAVSIFAAPYTVSHHKSTLLIAGLFSFFNAGSASNQSNHLFKRGAVHQSIHPRGCKFASGAYIMSPACEGAFTMVKGYHAHHHDTTIFPYSYLVDDAKGRSVLMPGANLASYGTCRDIAKWPQRDKRHLMRDHINYEEYNPYTTGMMVKALNALNALMESDESADEYVWERVVIGKSHARRGVGLYQKAIAASIGAMLERGAWSMECLTYSDWIDVAGAYVPQSYVTAMLDDLESGHITDLSQIDGHFEMFAQRYDDYAHTWAYSLLSQLNGHPPTTEEVAQSIESACKIAEGLDAMRQGDMRRDMSMQMAVGYGYDSLGDEETKRADFHVVQGV